MRCLAILAIANIVLVMAFSCPAHALDPTLVEQARKEGRVVWLTTQIMGELALPLAAAFKSSYGIEVTVNRATPRLMGERLVQAARSPQTSIDLVDGRGAIPQLKRAGLLAPLDSETIRLLPPELSDRDGYWVATNVYFNAIAVNTDLVQPERRPRTLEDLLKPEWSGRMVWSGQSTLSSAAGFIGTVLRERGDDGGRAYLAQLGKQQIATFDVSSRQIIDKVISGQFELGLQVFHHQAALSAGRGAPIAWLPVEPLTGSVTAIAITRQSARPNAARLFVDFLLSRQGQELFREAEILPVAPEVEPKDPSLRPAGGKFRAVYVSPEETEAGMQDWQALRAALFP